MSRPNRFRSTRTKAPPTTVRLAVELDKWVREQAATHEKGQSGIINDAVRHYRHIMDEQGHIIFRTIVGVNGHGTEDAR